MNNEWFLLNSWWKSTYFNFHSWAVFVKKLKTLFRNINIFSNDTWRSWRIFKGFLNNTLYRFWSFFGRSTIWFMVKNVSLLSPITRLSWPTLDSSTDFRTWQFLEQQMPTILSERVECNPDPIVFWSMTIKNVQNYRDI
jgi:hypothetical protein